MKAYIFPGQGAQFVGMGKELYDEYNKENDNNIINEPIITLEESFFDDLADDLTNDDELEKYKNKEIICYCRSGNRSLNSASLLKKHGFNSANMKGGIVTWNFSNKK